MMTFGFDANKGITKIEYDLLGNPTRIQFSNFNVVEYVYTADGRWLNTMQEGDISLLHFFMLNETSRPAEDGLFFFLLLMTID